jgi:LemA protein
MSEEKIDVGYDWREEKSPGGMKGKGWIALLLALILIGGTTLWSYNSLVGLSEAVGAARAQVESNIQRKADLLPNLVKTVKAYAKHEEKVFGEVGRLRSEATGKALGDMQAASALDAKLSGALVRLMAVAENYPDLKASEQFRQLQAQIEGAENRINVTRMLYNDTAREYNAALKKIPGRFVAPLLGLHPAEYFRADATAKNPLKLEI